MSYRVCYSFEGNEDQAWIMRSGLQTKEAIEHFWNTKYGKREIVAWIEEESTGQRVDIKDIQ